MLLNHNVYIAAESTPVDVDHDAHACYVGLQCLRPTYIKIENMFTIHYLFIFYV